MIKASKALVKTTSPVAIATRAIPVAFATRAASPGAKGSSAPSRPRSALLALGLATLAMLLLAAPALAAGDANEPLCPSATESSSGFRTYLPDCRAYELVNPPFKAGTLVTGGSEPALITPDGNRLFTQMGGAFASAGNDIYNNRSSVVAYQFDRTAIGWQPRALTPPASRFPYSSFMAISAADFATTLWGASTSKSAVNHEDIYLRRPDGTFALIGPGAGPEAAALNLGFTEELTFAGASRDLSHAVFSIRSLRQAGSDNLWPGDTTENGVHSLYEYISSGSPVSEPALVAVKNEGLLHSDAEAQMISPCGAELGSGVSGSSQNAVSVDGETVIFTANACGGSPEVNELYARLGAEKTLAVSEPAALPPGAQCTNGHACFGATPKNAEFQGASEDGSKVFFLTEQPLVNGDEDSSSTDLYMAEIEGQGTSAHLSKLLQVSHDPTPSQPAEVQGVVRVSEDGSHVYFVAKGALTAGANREGKTPELGADNLYVYDTASQTTAFVATLLTRAEEASLEEAEAAEHSEIEAQAHSQRQAREVLVIGELERGEISFERAIELLREAAQQEETFIRKTLGTKGPSGTLAEDRLVWQRQDERPAQATPDGRFLLFPSSADLTADDHSAVPQLFRYDDTAEALTRVSIGQGAAFHEDGNVASFHDAPQISRPDFVSTSLGSNGPTAALSRIALSGDGSSVFFTSAASLTPQAVSGSPSVYEYRGGDVFLLSDGHDSSLSNSEPTVQLFGVDPSGRDALFTTAAPLVPQQGDTQMNLYDVRTGGGFPASAAPAACQGDACQGPLAVPSATQAPGSSSFAGPGNSRPQRHHKRRRHRKRQSRAANTSRGDAR